MKKFIEILTSILAIVAIVFAIVQFSDSRHLIQKVEELLGTASTRYVDEFPQDISGIQDVMTGTCAELDIMVSIPGYAQYSKPKDFDRYKAALVAVAKSVLRDNKQAKKCLGKKLDGKLTDDSNAHVKLLLFLPDLRKAAMRDQFRKEDVLKDLAAAGGSAQQKFIAFFTIHSRLIAPDTPEVYLNKVLKDDYDGFMNKLEFQHHVNEDEYINEGIEIKYSKEQYMFYVWLQDHQEAAFSFDNRPVNGGGKQITFRTRDEKLLDVFSSVFNQEWERAKPYDEVWKTAPKSK